MGTFRRCFVQVSVCGTVSMRLASCAYFLGFLLTSADIVQELTIETGVIPETFGAVPVSTEKRLISYLLDQYENQGKMGRPVTNTMDNLTVYFGLSLIQVLDVDESNQVLKTSIWYQYNWTDVTLQWEPDKHDNIRSVRVPSSKIWIPDIFLYNFADDRLTEQRDALVVVSSTGNIMWMPQAILRSSCSFNTKYFPYDVQTCWLKFGSWTYSGQELDIEFVHLPQLDLSDYVMSNEWDITGNMAIRHIQYYTCCPDPYPDLTFMLTLKRKTAFYTFILILPCTLLSLLTLVIFWVPPESPAKLQLGMSVFVAFFFLLLVLADFTPRASASIPLIGGYFCLSMTMITLSTVLACVVAKMYFRGVRVNRAPSWMRCCLVNGVAKFLKLDAPKPSSYTGNNSSNKKHELGTAYKESGFKAETDLKMTKVRLLDNGVNSQMIVQHEVVDAADIDCGYGSFPGRETSVLLEDIKQIKQLLMKKRNDRLTEEEKKTYLREWRVIACITDRLFFGVYVTMNVITVGVLFYGS